MPKKPAKYQNFSTLEFLTSPFGVLKNIAEFFEKNLVNLTGKNRVFELLLKFPLKAQEIKFCPTNLAEVQNDELVVVRLKIEKHLKPKTPRSPYKIVGHSLGGYVNLVFFKIFPPQVAKLAVGKEVLILGHFKKSLNENQIVHPQEIREVSEEEKLPKINLIYPLSGSLTQKIVRGKIEEILRFLRANFKEEKARKNDWIDSDLLAQKKWPLFIEALCVVHNFGFEFGLNAQKRAKERLKYDEILAWQLAMLMVKKRDEKSKEIPEIGDDFAEEFLQKLPFEATNAQKKACREIRGDILSQKIMTRLLQGDVGSGKTVVALYGCLLAFGCKKQSCVIVPIAILADQHFAYFKKMAGDFGVRVAILSGKTTKKKRDKILLDLKNGEIDVLISTHAVLQDDVEFKNLGFAVIDEQHRFGVMQRLKLVEKGRDVDVLLMSATPIPRSLMMSFYGDMDVSILDEKPKNRLEIETLVKSQNRCGEVIEGVKRAIERGEKIYWICPLIEKSEEEGRTELSTHLSTDLSTSCEMENAVEKHKKLCDIFGGDKVALLHGKMKVDEKEKIMASFKGGARQKKSPQILVATTVIEVGVDVGEATIIVIENAENFGLSQLHQLRGRVGRSDKKSYCILLYGKKYGNVAKNRLEIMRESNDGFFIAQQDLKLRGSGEMLGVRQSGMAQFRLANLEDDFDLLQIAAKNGREILQNDPGLEKNESAKYRVLLKLFDYGDCLKIIKGG